MAGPVGSAGPAGFAVLRPHQARFIQNELRTPNPGKIVDHELGSGKTLTVISAIEALRHHEPQAFGHLPVLVLTSKTLVDGFKQELIKSTPYVKSFTNQEHTTRLDLYTVTTTERFYNRCEEYANLVKNPFILVIDEAHKLRNPKSKRYRVVFQAAKNACKTYLMTGTPIINYSVDIAPLINLILSDKTRTRWEHSYARQPKLPLDGTAPYLPNTLMDWNKVPDTIIHQYTRCLVSHFREDHTSAEYRNHFPTVSRYIVRVSMAPEHHKTYKKLASETTPTTSSKRVFRNQLIRDMTFTAQDISEFQRRIRAGPTLADTRDMRFLAYMMKLRQACNQVVGDDGVDYLPKIAHATFTIIERHRADPNYKASITTVFIDRGVRLVQAALRKAGIPFVTITGQKEEFDTKTAVAMFNSGRVRVMIFSAAGQHGLDLHGTHDTFNINLHWHRPAHHQAEARVIRFDSHKNSIVKHVNSYTYLAIFPPDSKDATERTADQYMHELGLKKEEENQRLYASIPTHCVESTTLWYLTRCTRIFTKNQLPNQPPTAPKRKPTPSSQPTVRRVKQRTIV